MPCASEMRIPTLKFWFRASNQVLHPLQIMIRHLALSILVLVLSGQSHGAEPGKPPANAKPALTVSIIQPRFDVLPIRVVANGDIAPWQEASIGAEAGGLRLVAVSVNVGDRVKKGQELARFAAETVTSELAEARANLAEARASLAEAMSDARRARELRAEGFVSEQRVIQADTAEQAALARVEVRQAYLAGRETRLDQTRVLAPDNGVITARSATVGAVPAPGQELFRLIRQGRLEWRGEVQAAELSRLKPGLPVRLTLPDGSRIPGKLRVLSPAVDAGTRNGLVYVDLPAPGSARAGMFAQGEIEIGESRGLTLPQESVVLREGFAYVLRLGGDNRVILTKVSTGQRWGGRVEIRSGLDVAARVVANGGAFLADGDLVRVAVPEQR